MSTLETLLELMQPHCERVEAAGGLFSLNGGLVAHIDALPRMEKREDPLDPWEEVEVNLLWEWCERSPFQWEPAGPECRVLKLPAYSVELRLRSEWEGASDEVQDDPAGEQCPFETVDTPSPGDVPLLGSKDGPSVLEDADRTGETRNRTAGWFCHWCWRPCAGLDANGFCLTEDRSKINARVRTLPVPGKQSVRRDPVPEPPRATVPSMPGGSGPAVEAPEAAAETRAIAFSAVSEAFPTPAARAVRAAAPETLTEWHAELPGAWRWVVLLGSQPVRLALAAGPGWVRVAVAGRNGIVCVADRLQDLPFTVLFGRVTVRRRERGPCPVWELAEELEQAREMKCAA